MTRAAAALGTLLALGPSRALGPDVPPKPDEILRRAEAQRNPDVARAVEIDVSTLALDGTTPERRSSYTLLSRGRSDALLLRRSEDRLRGSTVLLAAGKSWMLLPNALSKEPTELKDGQILVSDLLGPWLARLDLSSGWSVVLAGEESFGGVPCFKLELQPSGEAGPYGRVLYWVARTDFRPRRLECYLRSGPLANMTRFEEFAETPHGALPARMVIESASPSQDMHTVRLYDARPLAIDRLDFGPAGMTRLREAARARGALRPTAPRIPIEEILR
jgi:hypothetical protein